MKYEVEKIRYGDNGTDYITINTFSTLEEAEIEANKIKLRNGYTFYEEVSIRVLDSHEDCVDIIFLQSTDYKKRKPTKDGGLLGHIFFVPEV